MQVTASNAVTRTGTGPPMVLVHGFGCDQTMWNRLLPELEGFELIRYDLTGFGRSEYHQYDAKKYSSLHAHAEDLIHILDELDVGPTLGIGQSVSALVVGLAAAKRPDLFSKLVMIGVNPCYINDPPYMGGFEKSDIDGLLQSMRDNFIGWSGNLAGMVAGEGHDGEAEELNNRFCRNDPTIAMHFAEVTFLSDHRDDLQRIPHETLLLQCEHDVIAPMQMIEYVAKSMPNASVAMLDGHGHAPHMSDPEATAEAILHFI